MADSWRDYELGELIELKRGYDLPKANRLDGKVPIISSSGISGFHAQVKVKAPGVVTGRYGTIGEVFYSENDYWPLNTTLYVKDFKGNDAIFIYYLLKTISFSDYSDKGAVPGINRNHVHKAKVRAPICSRVQKLIGEQLFQYEQRIELNKQTNQTLEHMAQALFKSWFVDFDPVFDNAFDAGLSVDYFPDELQHRAILRQQHRSEALQQGAEVMMPQTPQSTAVLQPQNQQATQTESERIRGLFPNEFEQCDDPSVGINGWIPKGWIKDTLDSVAKYSSSRLDGTELNIDNYISTENMLSNKMGITQASSIPLNIKTMPAFHQGHVLISNIRPYFQKIWMATSSGGRSNDVLGFEVLDKKTEAYLLNLLYQDSFFEYMMTTSTGSKMPRGDKKAIMDWKVVVSPIKTREVYSEMVKEFYQAISLRVKENQCLTHLRDTLLPKLISGELKFSEAVQSIETK
jgi:type I restriction enzyme S subunit